MKLSHLQSKGVTIKLQPHYFYYRFLIYKNVAQAIIFENITGHLKYR